MIPFPFILSCPVLSRLEPWSIQFRLWLYHDVTVSAFRSVSGLVILLLFLGSFEFFLPWACACLVSIVSARRFLNGGFRLSGEGFLISCAIL